MPIAVSSVEDSFECTPAHRQTLIGDLPMNAVSTAATASCPREDYHLGVQPVVGLRPIDGLPCSPLELVRARHLQHKSHSTHAVQVAIGFVRGVVRHDSLVEYGDAFFTGSSGNRVGEIGGLQSSGSMHVRILSLRYSSSRSPYARRWMTRILLLSPSTKPSDTLFSGLQ